jgi:NADP-dependent 3-hydroxy acid dehydrogenase YdfG
MGAVFDFFAFYVALVARLAVDVVALALAPFIFCFERFHARSQPRSPRSILITGASSGIGRALAIEWASPGVTLFLTARDANRLAETRDRCTARGAEVFVDAADVCDAAVMKAVIERAEERRPLDLVVANAGVSGSSFEASIGTKELSRVAAPMLATNVQGIWNTLLPALPGMRARRSGQLVIVSSIASFTPRPGSVSYYATKMAARGIGEGLRAVLMSEGIGVSVVCPGLVESGMTIGEKGCMGAAVAACVFRDGIERNVGIITATHEREFLLAWIVGSLHPVLRGALFRFISSPKDAPKQLGALPPKAC